MNIGDSICLITVVVEMINFMNHKVLNSFPKIIFIELRPIVKEIRSWISSALKNAEVSNFLKIRIENVLYSLIEDRVIVSYKLIRRWTSLHMLLCDHFSIDLHLIRKGGNNYKL